jgi:predicted RNA-binding Zn-ribbon protein involved in translation (DUF1610 family)
MTRLLNQPRHCGSPMKFERVDREHYARAASGEIVWRCGTCRRAGHAWQFDPKAQALDRLLGLPQYVENQWQWTEEVA